MVRLKCRYILGEIVFTDGQTKTNYNSNTVIQCIRDNIEELFGEEGLGKSSQVLQGKLLKDDSKIS